MRGSGGDSIRSGLRRRDGRGLAGHTRCADQAQCECQGNRLQTGVHIQALADARHMTFYCRIGDTEPPSDGFVRQTFAEQQQDFPLPTCQDDPITLAGSILSIAPDVLPNSFHDLAPA